MKAKDLFKFQDVYHASMKKKKRFVLVIATVPSGLISDKIIPEQFGIILIKSPRAKRISTHLLYYKIPHIVEKLDTDLICLKQKHSDGYYEETQMCMGLSGVSYADFV